MSSRWRRIFAVAVLVAAAALLMMCARESFNEPSLHPAVTDNSPPLSAVSAGGEAASSPRAITKAASGRSQTPESKSPGFPEATRPDYSSLATRSSRQLWHQAAVTGDIRDWLLARQLMLTCYAAPNYKSKVHGVEFTADQIAAFESLQSRCDGGVGNGKPKIRNGPHSLSGDLQPLFAKMESGEPPNETERRQLLQMIRAERSASLLEALRGKLVNVAFLNSLGLDGNEGEAGLDSYLLDWAITIRACQERGDCVEGAKRRHLCQKLNDCVESLEQYPARRVFGPIDQRSYALLGYKHISPAAIRMRWERVYSKVDYLLGGSS